MRASRSHHYRYRYSVPQTTQTAMVRGSQCMASREWRWQRSTGSRIHGCMEIWQPMHGAGGMHGAHAWRHACMGGNYSELYLPKNAGFGSLLGYYATLRDAATTRTSPPLSMQRSVPELPGYYYRIPELYHKIVVTDLNLLLIPSLSLLSRNVSPLQHLNAFHQHAERPGLEVRHTFAFILVPARDCRMLGKTSLYTTLYTSDTHLPIPAGRTAAGLRGSPSSARPSSRGRHSAASPRPHWLPHHCWQG